ncbi:MAG: hypothetical protein ABL903_12110, partial [Methylococcales bacterium]
MSKQLRILHFIYALSGGGAERQLQFLLKYAPENSSHGVLCVEPGDIDLSKFGAEVFVHQRQGKFDWGLYHTCYKTIKTFKPDVLHLWLPPVLTIPAMSIGALLKKPMIFSYRSRMSFERPLMVLEYVLALLFSKKVISNNSVLQSAKHYQLLYHCKNGITLSNGLDFSVIGKKNDFEVKHNKPIKMIFVGRLVKEKNIINLILALDKIP